MTMLLGWLAFSVATGMFAQVRRHRNGVGWFFIAILISPLIAFVMLLILLPLDPAPAPVWPTSQSLTIENVEPPPFDKSAPIWLGVVVVVGLLILLGLSMTKAKADEQQQIFRDASGRIVTTATQSGNQTTYRDAGGRTTGSSTVDSTGATVLRDAGGRTIGTVSGRR